MQELKRWYDLNGEENCYLNHPLNENSKVIIFGGYIGKDVERLYNKYNCHIIVFEPIKEYFLELNKRFINTDKVVCINDAVGTHWKTKTFYIQKESTSSFFNKENENNTKQDSIMTVPVNLLFPPDDIIDLVEFNIEGDEYEILKHMIDNHPDLFERIKRLQIQFHDNIPDCINLRNKIEQDLFNIGYKPVYSFPFVWECYTK